MILVIDGYNVLKYGETGGKHSEHDRERFIEILNRYATAKKLNIILVFDSGPTIWPFREKHGRVLVIYVGQGESADHFIIDYVQEHKEKDLVVVSSDREIVQGVSSFRIETISAADFYQLLKHALIPSVNIIKKSSPRKFAHVPDQPEVDQLMLYGSSLPIKKMQEKEAETREREKQQQSKKEKKREQKLKKL
ncbi:MAG: YacP-like NYN domain protein [Candidatus Dependentiae bacterium ADurb.Bin331]|nr:MAG: YacP-like NYN domain protein [Candidatus Dependentiae bacterium ADurb.Bin331]